MYTFTKIKVVLGPGASMLHVGPCTRHHREGMGGGDHPPPFWRSYWFGWVRHPLPVFYPGTVTLGLVSPRPFKDEGTLRRVRVPVRLASFGPQRQTYDVS